MSQLDSLAASDILENVHSNFLLINIINDIVILEYLRFLWNTIDQDIAPEDVPDVPVEDDPVTEHFVGVHRQASIALQVTAACRGIL